MAAKPLPELALWTIDISPTGTVNSNGYIKINALDSIAFHNGAPFPVNIVFTSNFNEISDLQPGADSAAEGGTSSLNVTIDYSIYNANTQKITGGPYAVQFGNGPLTVNISSLNTSPDPIAIPNGGQIAFNSDEAYKIAWEVGGQSATVWSPQPSKMSVGVNGTQTALPGGNGETVTYSITAPSNTQGGGTVHIGN